MHDDDRPVGRFLSRRELVSFFGAAASGTLLARRASGGEQRIQTQLPLPDCVAQPRQTEGPYFVDERIRRSDIRVDSTTGTASAGAPLELRFEVQRVSADGVCSLLPGAQVDIWHCDALGVYSDVADRRVDTTGQNFLRGYQVTDEEGRVRFDTIYPGWYRGRAVHVHFKVRVPGDGGRTDEFTSQLYFDDDLTNRVHALEPYAANKGQRLLNARDMIFREGGTQLLLPVVEEEGRFAATFRIALRPGEPEPRVGPGRGGRGRPPMPSGRRL
jgi:protocatechuate 3,4-dioxygenase beta subunit